MHNVNLNDKSANIQVNPNHKYKDDFGGNRSCRIFYTTIKCLLYIYPYIQDSNLILDCLAKYNEKEEWVNSLFLFEMKQEMHSYERKRYLYICMNQLICTKHSWK